MTQPPMPYGVTQPRPLWTIDADANEQHRLAQQRAHVARLAIEAMVTEHPVPYLADPVTASLGTLKRLAESKGMRTEVATDDLAKATLRAVHVALGVGFAMTWERGRPIGGTWHERETRWGMVDDPRPEGVSKVSRLALAKHRGAGLDARHLKYLGGPMGVVRNVTQITALVKALP